MKGHFYREIVNAKLLAVAGLSLEQIMDRLDHTDNQITKKYISTQRKIMKKEASQKFTELMRSLR
jgi:hypothetical protein